MPRRHVLVVARHTARSDRLHAALLARAQEGPAEFTLLLPAPVDADEALPLIRDVVARLRAAGLDVAGRLGEEDPYAAVAEVWDPAEYDEIVIGTLAPERSRWLALDVLARIEGLTGVEVVHVVADVDAASGGPGLP
jgi:hypothetical protein